MVVRREGVDIWEELRRVKRLKRLTFWEGITQRQHKGASSTAEATSYI